MFYCIKTKNYPANKKTETMINVMLNLFTSPYCAQKTDHTS